MDFSDFDIKRIYLTLGLACNLKCRYCIQNQERRGLAKHPSGKLIAYLQHMADIRPRRARLLPTSISVTLFGGEPLLYFDAAKEVVERVNRDNINWLLETNGTLLTDDIVDFCNAHNIKVVVSNDGPESVKTRGLNIFEDAKFVSSFNRLEKRGIECVLTAFSQDIHTSLAYWKERVGDCPTTFAFLIPNQDYPLDLTEYDLKAWEKTCQKIADDAYTGIIGQQENYATKMMRSFTDKYAEFLDGRAMLPRCEAYCHAINLDLEGNTYLCHSGMGKFGNLSKSTTKLSREARILFLNLHTQNRSRCLDCKWFAYCRALCPFARPGLQDERNCEFMVIFYEAVVRMMRRVNEQFSTPVDL